MSNQIQARGMDARNSLLEFFERHAKSAYAYLTLYRDYQHFEWSSDNETVVLAYVDTPTAWVGAADPVGPAELWWPTIEAFAEAAKVQGKEALILPVSVTLAAKMRERRRFVVQIGSEPWMHLGHKHRGDRLRALPMARQLSRRGAKVEEFVPNQISADEHLDLEVLNRKWLRSKQTIPLGFLNRLDPWSLMKAKKYFRIMFEGQACAYLAAVPVPSRQAWYFVDIVRDPDAPTGTTELLIVEAMAELDNQGAREVTLGMAPLARQSVSEQKQHPKLHRALDFAFRHGNLFYGFQSLYKFKQKLEPSEWRPLYLVAASDKITWRAWYGLFCAIYPKGILRTTWGSLSHLAKKIKMKALLEHFLASDVVHRPLPENLRETFARMKAVAALLTVNVLFYFLTVNSQGEIRPIIKEHFVYSWEHMFHAHTVLDSLGAMVLPGVLHWNLSHLVFNLVLLVVAVGLTEIVASSALACIAYLSGSIFSNVLTSLIIYSAMDLFHPASLATFIHEPDIGCSLGIAGCAGALAHLSRYPKTLATIVIVASLVGSFTTGIALELNHITAFFIGLVVAKNCVN